MTSTFNNLAKATLTAGVAAYLSFGLANAQTGTPKPDAAAFAKIVTPVLKNNCSGCHNASMNSGGVNLLAYNDAATLSTDREAWDRIVQKIESGEMPPAGAPRPPQAQMSALVAHLKGEFARADAAVRPDPGRVTARRLNRNEYRNTVRDLQIGRAHV